MLSSSTLEGADIPGTVFENYVKGLIKHWSILASFWKHEVCGQTVLPDILSNFQTICKGQKLRKKSH